MVSTEHPLNYTTPRPFTNVIRIVPRSLSLFHLYKYSSIYIPYKIDDKNDSYNDNKVSYYLFGIFGAAGNANFTEWSDFLMIIMIMRFLCAFVHATYSVPYNNSYNSIVVMSKECCQIWLPLRRFIASGLPEHTYIITCYQFEIDLTP